MTPTRILSSGSKCRDCACTDVSACIIDAATGDVLTDQSINALTLDGSIADRIDSGELSCCYWVEPDLCSSCAQFDGESAAEAPPLLVDAEGRPLRGAP